MKNIRVIFVCLLLICVSFSCQKQKNNIIVLDNSEPLALAPDIEWAVVTDPYAAYKVEPLWSASVSGHCRKGEILQIKGKSLNGKKENWFYFDNGWLPENCLSVFNNRLKAKSVSEQILTIE